MDLRLICPRSSDKYQLREAMSQLLRIKHHEKNTIQTSNLEVREVWYGDDLLK